MKKRLMSSFMALSILLSFAVPASAAEKSQETSRDVTTTNDVLTLVSRGHGQYELLSETANSVQNHEATNGETITAYATEDEEIYYVRDDIYLANVVGNTYLMLKRVPLSTADGSSNASILQTYQVDDSMQRDIAETIKKQKEINNNDFSVEIYVPMRAGTTTYPNPVYYTYNGNKMLDKFVKYSNLSVGTGEIKGTSVKGLASAFKNLILSAVGTTVPAVAMFGVADSALAFYQAAHGTVSYSSASDKTYTNISFDKLVKSTYVGLGSNYLLGCKSEKVWLNTNFTYQYYQAKGKHQYGEVFLNQTRYTASYNNAAYVATRNVSSAVTDAHIKAVIHGKTCVF